MTETTRALLTPVNPAELGRPAGFTHGLLAAPGAQVLLIAGQTAADANGRIADAAFAAQFDAALARVIAVVEGAGGRADNIGRMTVFVTDMEAYLAARPALREPWRRRMGGHYPAMTLVAVSRLVDPGATVEIDAIAVLPTAAA